MKLTTLWPGVLLAITGGLAMLSSATAAVTVYAAGDLILGFRDNTKAADDYLVNIGQASLYRDAAGSFDLNIGPIGTDLVSLYGAGWATDPDIHWSVTGTTGSDVVGTDPAITLYSTREEPTPGTQATAWVVSSGTNRGAARNKMVGLASSYTGQESTVNNPLGLRLGPNSINSYSSYQPGGTAANAPGGISFGVYNPSVEGSFANGAAGTALDLFRIPNTAAAASYEGTFTINPAGQVRFNLSPVPEPGSLALLGVALGLVATRRRRNHVTA